MRHLFGQNLHPTSLLTSCFNSAVQTEFAPLLPPVESEGVVEEHIRFRWFHSCAEDWETPVFLLVISNYPNHSPVTGWHTTSALVWFAQGSTGPSLAPCFFFFFPISIFCETFQLHYTFPKCVCPKVNVIVLTGIRTHIQQYLNLAR